MIKTSKKKVRTFTVIMMVLLALAVIIMLSLALFFGRDEEESPSSNITIEPIFPEINTGSEGSAGLQDTDIDLGNGLVITNIGNYTGTYMEDGSDEILSGILMMVVTNKGEEAIQYAEIKLSAGEGEGFFKLSTLPAGKSVVLLEQNRMNYDKSIDYSNAVAENMAFFTEPMSLKEDQLKLGILDGAINVKNISDQDITGDIVIYYKNSASDLYYGGITYRIRIEGGLAAGEIRQAMGNHLSESGSAVMFVTIG